MGQVSQIQLLTLLIGYALVNQVLNTALQRLTLPIQKCKIKVCGL
jgi:hypothetical protein